MSSRFFNPAFNSAIFDGPLRIYFAQMHESLALKVYFSLQQKYPEMMESAKEQHKSTGQTMLVMLYPNADAFQMSFENQRQFLVEDRLGEDTLIGINGPFEDEKLNDVLQAILHSITSWPKIRAIEQDREQGPGEFSMEAQL